jgi:hypothetical protein
MAGTYGRMRRPTEADIDSGPSVLHTVAISWYILWYVPDHFLRRQSVGLCLPGGLHPYGPKTADLFDVKTDISGSWSKKTFFDVKTDIFWQLEQRHTELSLIFFSTFEPITLTHNSDMQSNGANVLRLW